MNEKSVRRSKAKPFKLKLFATMIVITVLQLCTFLAVLLFGGEFGYIKKYAYNTFIEKNANRKTYLESFLVQKPETVLNTVGEINRRAEHIFREQGKKAEDIKTDKELNRIIVNECADAVITMMRQAQVNDAFLFLDSGDTFSTADSGKKYGIYIRDMDPGQNSFSDNKDLLMELGSADLAASLGVVLDFEWAALLDVSSETNDLSFYLTTIETARQNPGMELYELGFWSGFSGISRSASKSMKYTLPLIADDGTVYGVAGIGITEKLIQDTLPSADSFSGEMCYILAADDENNGIYTPLLHTGPMYSRLVTKDTVLSRQYEISRDIYDFNFNSESINSIGNIQDLRIYNSASAYKTHNWALISVGDEKGIMGIYMGLVRMFALSSAVSVVISIIGALIINSRMTRPVNKMIESLYSRDAENTELVEFESSNISEIDALGNSIVRLQINVMENASRVSRLISMSDAGIGVFMYSFSSGNVFIGESLVKLLDLTELPVDRDSVIPFDSFKEYMARIDRKNSVCSDKIFSAGENENSKTDIVIENKSDVTGAPDRWIKFSLTRDSSNVICLVQDITASVLEKKRIEFERDYDVTTGLLNRRAYLTKLEQMFKHPERLKTAAVIMMDLDNLKYVNDTYGHDFGDNYIRTAASIFKNFSSCGGVVARLSGDEFNIFLSGFESKDQIRETARKIQEIMLKSYCLLADGTQYRIRASGGIAWYPDHADNYERLMKYADFAMYTIKHSTKGQLAEFDPETYKKDSILITGIEEMNRIIEEEQVRYALQSIISAKTGDIYGYELLMRPKSDIIRSPLDFIRIAKTSAKLYEIERLTWVNGLASFTALVDKGFISKGTKIFINSLSNCIVNKADLSLIEHEYGDYLSDIVLEVLEGEENNENYTLRKKELIGKWGAMIALDDFGTGYNGEYLFIKLGPDLIKIDRSIISGCNSDEGKREIILGLVSNSHSKNCLVLAEGVENADELETVIACGVDLLQGYYINRPVFEPVPVKEQVIEEIKRFNEKVKV